MLASYMSYAQPVATSMFVKTYSGKSVFGLVFFSILNRVVDKSETSRLSTSESSSEAKQNNPVHFADFEHLKPIVMLR